MLIQGSGIANVANDVLSIMEINKNAVLAIDIKMDELIHRNTMFPAVAKKELALRSAMSQLRIRLESMKAESDNYTTVKDSLFQYRMAHVEMLETIKIDHPKYYQLFYNIQLPSLEGMREELLDEQSLLIQYYVGTSAIYRLSVSTETAFLCKIDSLAALAELVPMWLENSRNPSSDNLQIADIGYPLFYYNMHYLQMKNLIISSL